MFLEIRHERVQDIDRRAVLAGARVEQHLSVLVGERRIFLDCLDKSPALIDLCRRWDVDRVALDVHSPLEQLARLKHLPRALGARNRTGEKHEAD